MLIVSKSDNPDNQLPVKLNLLEDMDTSEIFTNELLKWNEEEKRDNYPVHSEVKQKQIQPASMPMRSIAEKFY